MKTKCLLLSVIICMACTLAGAQPIYDTRNGSSIPVHGTFRILNIFVNIVYDQNPERDPFYGQDTPQWRQGNPDVLNDQPPAYLSMFLDTGFDGKKPEGLMSRLFYESSLGHMIVLGDFVVVNVRQSEITPDKPGSNFDVSNVIRGALEKINKLGGLQTVYGHNRLEDYDAFEKGNPGVLKETGQNGKIDFIMIFVRNSYRKEEGGKVVYNYGQNNTGEGYSWESAACSKCALLVDGEYVVNEITTTQNVGASDLSQNFKNIAFHEFSHNLFGGNGFHTSGGNHFSTANAAVFMGLQGGYGLMGGANSSLVSVNGYERWRLGWIDTVTNSERFEVAVNGANGAISRKDGNATFILRDFITTGDALRIQLPYVDPGAEQQYLWLENHQVGRNGNIDFLQYSNEDQCRPSGSPGIYAFIQVGRDDLLASKMSAIFTNDEADNLRMLTAKGNWDMQLDTYYDTANCIAWRAVRPAESYKRANSFCGYNDLQSRCWDTTGQASKIDGKVLCTYPWIIRNMGVKESPLPFMGDNQTAFTGKSRLDMGSNPASVNVVTCYTTQYGMQFAPYKKVNNKKIYLSGLSVQMKDMGDMTFSVEVRWDDYVLHNNARWTGHIVLKEQLLLNSNVSLLLDQNETPIQLERDATSGYFSPVTDLVCDSGSTLLVGKGSEITLNQQSKLIVKKGATLKLEKGSKIYIRNASIIIIEQGALFEDKGCKFKMKSGGSMLKP